MSPDLLSSVLSARPRPIIMPPRNWLAAVLELMMRPVSNEPSQRVTRQRSSSSKRTSKARASRCPNPKS
jgi:hypothetical protein